MEHEELALGMRTGKMILSSTWQVGELELIELNTLKVEDVIKQWVLLGGDLTLGAVIGSLMEVIPTPEILDPQIAPQTSE